MSRSRSASVAADAFWRQVGGLPKQYPVDLDVIAPRAFEIIFIRLPRLSELLIHDWLSERGISGAPDDARSEICGGIFATRGAAVIFVNATLDEREIRMTVAHEVAHYLLHYYFPRKRAIERLGLSILPVIDGERQPTDAELLSGVLAGVDVRQYSHSWNGADAITRNQFAEREAEADLLAFELLAPKKLVLARSDDGRMPQEILAEDFGLPAWVCSAYGEMIHVQSRRSKSQFGDWLREI